MNRCVILCASLDTDLDYCKKEIKDSDYIICADGGYVIAKKLGIIPRLIVGDFDSYTGKLPDSSEIIKLPKEKDDTDTMFCIKEGLKRGFKKFILLGADGGRLDHTIANISALQYLSINGAGGVMESPEETVYFCSSSTLRLDNCKGKTVSVFPFGCESCNVSHSGFKYTLEKQDIQSAFPLGVSNIALVDKAAVTINSGNAVIIVNKRL